MKIIRMPRPNEQRKVEALLVKLTKLKPVNSKSVPIIPRVRTA